MNTLDLSSGHGSGHSEAPPPDRAGSQGPATVLDRVAFAIATFFGSGLFPFAPGTAGTAATIPLYLLLAHGLSTPAYVAAWTGLLGLGIWAAHRTSARVGLSDPGIVVIDETVGFLVTMTAVAPSPGAILLGFLVFRALDVLKPLGIRQLERMPGGFGIMMDDFAAGIVGNVAVRLLLELRPPATLPLF